MTGLLFFLALVGLICLAGLLLDLSDRVDEVAKQCDHLLQLHEIDRTTEQVVKRIRAHRVQAEEQLRRLDERSW